MEFELPEFICKSQLTPTEDLLRRILCNTSYTQAAESCPVYDKNDGARRFPPSSVVLVPSSPSRGTSGGYHVFIAVNIGVNRTRQMDGTYRGVRWRRKRRRECEQFASVVLISMA
jgi:hypothetical protein